VADTLQDHRQVGAPQQLTQQYDSTAADGSVLGRWVKVTSGPCDAAGTVAGDWPSSGVWQQT
jgi:hypothetical protein